MMAMANSFQIPEATVKTATQIFKMAAIQNFIQGRRMEAVAAVCLYTACRQEEECRIMLIDFADRLQVSSPFVLFLLWLTNIRRPVYSSWGRSSKHSTWQSL